MLFREASKRGDDLVSRALRTPSFWLALTYVALILLMARTYT
jgi:hypothetical protein